jgi:polysaccharide biosynthesis protein PslH
VATVSADRPLGLLYLTSAFPYPLDSGHLRHYFLVRELAARGHQVTLVSLTGRRFDPSHVGPLLPHTAGVRTVPTAPAARSPARKALRRLAAGTAADGAVRRMSRTAAELSRQTRFDVAITGKRTLRALKDVPGLPIVADLCDASSARLRRNLRYADAARLPMVAAKLVAMRRSEQALLQASAHRVFISARDRDDLLGGAAARTSIVPNGIDLDFWRRSAPPPSRPTLVFTGAMNYRPNADAAVVAAHDILPLVRLRVPDAALVIVGRDPLPEVVALRGVPGVTVTGQVSDVRPFLERAAVFVAPLRFGAGMQNKLLEALAMELPVVASPLAAEGLRPERGDAPPVVLADEPEDLAGRVVDVLSMPHRRWPAGREFVATHYTWAKSAAVLVEACRQVSPRDPTWAAPAADQPWGTEWRRPRTRSRRAG